jgi:thiol-disulfide isomerase/thioredoxin
MRKISICGLAVFATVLLCACVISMAEAQPPVGGVLPDFKLSMPGFADKRYLGISGFGSFGIPEINAKLVIIEIFSMYCPFCQREAPNVNQLYEKIQQDPGLRDAIKIIGIGVGNSPYEVDVFKKRYNVPFPLFADGDYSIHKKIGEVRTPYFIGVKISPDGSHQIVYSKLGGFEGADQFLVTMRRLSGL